MAAQAKYPAGLSTWYWGARVLVGREWRNYELRAAQYEAEGDPELIRSGRFSVKWKLAYALSLSVASQADSDEHAYFQQLAETLASKYPEVPWDEADLARFEKWRAWGRAGGRWVRPDNQG
jgi:hypothetical protein